MKQDNLKSVEFNGETIFYVQDNGVSYILIRPICQALGVDADWQIRNMKADEILGPEVREHTTQVPGDQQRRAFTALPEQWVYGWLFGIQMSNTMSEATKANLSTYKRECYKVLFNHFHGMMQERVSLLRQKSETEQEIQRLASILAENEDYQELLRLRSLKSGSTRFLNQMDEVVQKAQMGLFGHADE